MWRAALSLAYGTFETSHVASCPDVAPECSEFAIPDHEHRARLGLFHGDLIVSHGVNERLTLSGRLPYDVKDMEIEYRTLEGDSYEPPYGDIHHRTEVLRGLSDAELLATYTLAPGWLIGAGLTIPLGQTEADPIELGRRGLRHQHIQFGSGTVDPRLAIQWSYLLGRVQISAAGDARIPLYENRHGFKAPVTLRWSLGPNVSVGTTGLSVQFAGQYQSIGRWNGEVDEGTGFHHGGVFLNGSFLIAPALRVSPGIYLEAFSESLSEESFRQKPTFSIVVSRFFP
ncbi:MAG: hypothetical protein ABR576_02160 [Thermoanaerobaculia bacterium]